MGAASLSVVVLAAGLGRRYGGLKQLEPVGPSGERLLDYALYDALRAGFRRAVFVIRPEMEAAVRREVAAVWADRIEVVTAHQELDDAARAVRSKPWGTGHAVLCARPAVPGAFAVINADDYYGTEALRRLHDHLAQVATGGTADWALVTYRLAQTLSPHGPVCRGVCADREGVLTGVAECRDLRLGPAGVSGTDPAGQAINLSGRTPVSLNLWGFGPDLWPPLAERFAAFRARYGQDPTREFYLPSAVDSLIRSDRARVRVLPTAESWFGVTYREDRAEAQARIRALIDAGRYPVSLWSERS